MAITVQIGSTVTKDPEAERVYEIDWSLVLDGQAIATSVWEVQEGPDNLLLLDQDSKAGGSTFVRVKSGTKGARYRVSNKITFGSPANTEPGSFWVYIAEQ